MRLLHTRDDCFRRRAAAQEFESKSSGDPACDAGQRLSLRNLSAHRPGRANGRQTVAGGAEMSPFEPERYELSARRAYDFDLDRRDFFKLLGGGIIVFSMISDALAQESGVSGRGAGAQRAPREI